VEPVPDLLLVRKYVRAGNRTQDLWICGQSDETGKEKYNTTLAATVRQKDSQTSLYTKNFTSIISWQPNKTFVTGVDVSYTA
jgi:hypothetical protein